jgi:hypothetical protein
LVIVRVAPARNDYKDPGWYKHPAGTVAYEWTGEPPKVARASAPAADATTVKVRRGGGNSHH